MTKLHNLYKIADENKIDVDFFPMNALTSLSTPHAIAMDVDKIRDSREETAILGHELGHCMTGSFYRVNSSLETRERMEERANRWAIEELLPWPDLKKALYSGITEPWDLAEFFDLPQWFIEKAANFYRENCGFFPEN